MYFLLIKLVAFLYEWLTTRVAIEMLFIGENGPKTRSSHRKSNQEPSNTRPWRHEGTHVLVRCTSLGCIAIGLNELSNFKSAEKCFVNTIHVIKRGGWVRPQAETTLLRKACGGVTPSKTLKPQTYYIFKGSVWTLLLYIYGVLVGHQ